MKRTLFILALTVSFSALAARTEVEAQGLDTIRIRQWWSAKEAPPKSRAEALDGREYTYYEICNNQAGCITYSGFVQNKQIAIELRGESIFLKSYSKEIHLADLGDFLEGGEVNSGGNRDNYAIFAVENLKADVRMTAKSRTGRKCIYEPGDFSPIGSYRCPKMDVKKIKAELIMNDGSELITIHAEGDKESRHKQLLDVMMKEMKVSKNEDF